MRKEPKSSEDIFGDPEFIQAKKRVEARTNKAKTRRIIADKKKSLKASDWDIDAWITFVEGLAVEFDIPISPKPTDNIYKKRTIYSQLVDNGIDTLGSTSDVVEALANIIAGFKEGETPFFQNTFTHIPVPYISKAFSGYVSTIKREPALIDLYRNVTTTFTSRIDLYLDPRESRKWLMDNSSSAKPTQNTAAEDATSNQFDELFG